LEAEMLDELDARVVSGLPFTPDLGSIIKELQ
jgi:hypothetical protein